MEEIYDGIVKQQYLDKNGLFEWSRKALRLDVFSSSFEMADASSKAIQSLRDVSESEVEKVSIVDAKYAKEWMFSTSLAGFGFDLTWKSGKIWSFLVDDELECKNWVTNLNQSISVATKNNPAKVNESTDSNSFVFYSDVIDKSFTAVDQKSDVADTTFPFVRPDLMPRGYSTMGDRVSEAASSASSAFSTTSENKNDCNGRIDSHTVPPPTSSRSSAIDDNPINQSSSSTYIRNNYAKELEVNKEIANKASEHFLELQRRYLLLEQTLENKTSEHASTQALLENLQQEMDTRTALLEKKLEDAWEKERNLRLEAQNEIECRVLRAANENSSFYEANSQSIKIQHQRELTCLRDELYAERKRYSALFEKENSYRSKTEGKDVEIRAELSSMRDRLNDKHIEYQKLEDLMSLNTANWEREKKRYTSDYESKMSILQKEKDVVIKNAQEVMHSRIQELTKNFEASLKETHQADVGIMVQEMEGEKLCAIAEIQKKSNKELELVRNEERKLAMLEMEKLRSSFRKKEHQTVEDLIQLEKLHDTRVNDLEHQVIVLETKNEKLQEQVQDLKVEAVRGSSSVQQTAADYRDEMQQHRLMGEKLSSDVKLLKKELMESKVRENTYRDQLAQVLEDGRVKAAELQEAKQQASIAVAQSQQWQQVSVETDRSLSTMETSKEIARDEIVMLENELHRVRVENSSLREDLVNAERLVYGVPQHESPRTFRMLVGKQDQTYQSAYPASNATKVMVNNPALALSASKKVSTKKGRMSSSGHGSLGEGRGYLSNTAVSANRRQLAGAKDKPLGASSRSSPPGSAMRSTALLSSTSPHSYRTPVPPYNSSLATFDNAHRTRGMYQ